MKPSDQQHFTLLMTGIAELYNKKLSKPLLDIYWRCLEPYSFELIRTALKAHMLHPDGGQFMPKPADVLRIINGDSETRALQAWSKVLHAIRMVGSYDSIVFDDPLIHAAIMDLGGWPNLCSNDTKALVFIGKQFERIYSSYLQKSPTHYPKQLTGQSNYQNSQASCPLKTIRFLGNKANALQVWQSGCDPAEYTHHNAGTSINNSQLKTLTNELKDTLQVSKREINQSLPVNTGGHHED
jgi:hypothetical protein